MPRFFRAFIDGFRRVGRAWRVVVLLWLVNLALALPFAVALAGELDDHLGRSLVREELLEGFDSGWYGELQEDATGIVTTFAPELLGAGAFFDNLERWWKGDLFSVPPLLVGAGVVYALVWAFLLGGVLERLVHVGVSIGGSVEATVPGAAGFFAACGRHAFRFVRLALVSAVLYYLIYRLVRAGFGWLEDALGDVTSERTALAWTLAGVALTLLLLSLVRVVFDYAKIAVVTEGRRSALGAAWRGLRFVVSRPLGTLGLYWLFGVAAVVLLGLYTVVSPGPGQATWLGVILAFLLGQIALATRVALRLALLGGEVDYFRG